LDARENEAVASIATVNACQKRFGFHQPLNDVVDRVIVRKDSGALGHPFPDRLAVNDPYTRYP
jgi:hypothetical protein